MPYLNPPLRVFVKALSQRKAKLAHALFWRIAFVVLPMQVPIVAGVVVSALIGEEVIVYGTPLGSLSAKETLLTGSAALAAIALLLSIASFCQETATAKLTQSMAAGLRSAVADAAIRLLSSRFSGFKRVELLDRLVNDTSQVIEFTKRVCIQAIVNVARIGWPVVTLLFMDLWLAAMVLVVLVPQLLLSRKILAALHRVARNARDSRTELTGAVERAFEWATDGAEEAGSGRIKQRIHDLESNEFHAQRVGALNRANVWFFTSVGLAAVWCSGGLRVLEETLTIGELFAFTGLLAFVYQPLRQFSEIANVYKKGMVSLERIAEVLDAQSGEPTLAGGVQASREARYGESTHSIQKWQAQV